MQSSTTDCAPSTSWSRYVDARVRYTLAKTRVCHPGDMLRASPPQVLRTQSSRSELILTVGPLIRAYGRLGSSSASAQIQEAKDLRNRIRGVCNKVSSAVVRSLSFWVWVCVGLSYFRLAFTLSPCLLLSYCALRCVLSAAL